MAGSSSSKISRVKISLFLLSALILFCVLLTVQNKNTFSSNVLHPIAFIEVATDLNSKYSLVQLDNNLKSSDTLVLATFDVFNKNYATSLHQNDFWSPESCSKMPSIIIENNYLVTLDTKKVGSSFETNLFYFDIKKKKLFKSEPIAGAIGSLYKNSREELVFFSYKEKSLIRNSINLNSKKQKKDTIYAFNGESPRINITQVDDTFYFKLFFNESTSVKKLTNSTLVEALTIPDNKFWTIVNKNSEVFFYKKDLSFTLKKEPHEEYKLLKNSGSSLVFEVINKNNFDDYTIKLFKPSTRSLEIIYSNMNISNSHYVISVN